MKIKMNIEGCVKLIKDYERVKTIVEDLNRARAYSEVIDDIASPIQKNDGMFGIIHNNFWVGFHIRKLLKQLKPLIEEQI